MSLLTTKKIWLKFRRRSGHTKAIRYAYSGCSKVFNAMLSQKLSFRIFIVTIWLHILAAEIVEFSRLLEIAELSEVCRCGRLLLDIASEMILSKWWNCVIQCMPGRMEQCRNQIKLGPAAPFGARSNGARWEEWKSAWDIDGYLTTLAKKKEKMK